MNYAFVLIQIIFSDVRNLVLRPCYVALFNLYMQHEELRSSVDFIFDYLCNYPFYFMANLRSLGVCGKLLLQHLLSFLLSLTTLRGWNLFLNSLFMQRLMSLIFVTSLGMMFYQYFTAKDFNFKFGEPVAEVIVTAKEPEPIEAQPVPVSTLNKVFPALEEESTTPIKGITTVTESDPQRSGALDTTDDSIPQQGLENTDKKSSSIFEDEQPPIMLGATVKKPSRLASMLGTITRMRSGSRPTTPSRSRSNSRGGHFFFSSNHDIPIPSDNSDSQTTPANNRPNNTFISPLTPDSGFLALLQQGRQRSEEDDNDTLSESGSTGYSQSEGPSSSQSYLDDANATPDMIMKRSLTNPAVLIGWRVLVPGYGTGVVLSLKKKKFKSTKFVVQFENNQTLPLKLQRSKDKGNVPFQLLRKQR